MKKTGKIIYTAATVILVAVLAVIVFGLRLGGKNIADVESKAVDEPQEANTETYEPEITPEPVDYTVLKISEVMPANKATVADSSGSFPDWVELYNSGSEAIELSGCSISCGDQERSAIKGAAIKPQSYAVVLLDGAEGTDDGYLHADLSVSKDGATITLEAPDGTTIDELTFADVSSDESVYRDGNGELQTTDYPSPGYENTADGYAQFQSSRSTAPGLVIYEAMTYNDSVLKVGTEYYDWVELKNISSSAINLSDYYLSDKGGDRALYQLPDKTLNAGESVIVYCTDEVPENTEGKVFAPFGLSAGNERLYLSLGDGTLCDYVHLYNIPLGGSMGRISGDNGYYYFKTPSPSAENSGSYARSIAPTPILVGDDGVFNDVNSVTVELKGNGEIYYTLDGATPTANSTRYTGPFSVTSTCVVRAVCVENGCFNSETLDLSYIINENHTLPVVSLVMDTEDFQLMYNNPSVEYEKTATVSFFEDEGEFSIQCGVKLHGATSKFAQSKKSMKLCFRSRYEGELEYDLFNNGVTEFSSILLRTAQEDYYSTLMRDNFLQRLAAQAFPALSTQDTKYSVLYVNGEYRGIYDIREAHSAEHYANHYGYDADEIVQWKEQWPSDSEIATVFNFAVTHDLSVQENYDYVAQYLDIDSIIGWCIMEAYGGNYDAEADNMRFYYNKTTGVMSFALVDLDLAFFDNLYYSVPFDMGYGYNKLVNALLQSSTFRKTFMEQLGNALSTTLSDENVNAMIDEVAAEIRPEITRDRERWGSTLDRWESMVNDLHKFANGRAAGMVTYLNNYIAVTQSDRDTYFSNVK